MSQRDTIKGYEKQLQALTLALQGSTYQSIADTVGYHSAQTAWKAVQSALKKTIRPLAEEVRQMQIARLDQLLSAVWNAAMNGHLGAVDRALRIEGRRMNGMLRPHTM